MRMDGRTGEIVNRFCIAQEEGAELIPWAVSLAAEWQRESARMSAKGMAYPDLQTYLKGVYKELKSKANFKDVVIARFRSSEAISPAMVKSVKESVQEEPETLEDMSDSEAIHKFTAGKAMSVGFQQWMNEEKAKFRAYKEQANTDMTLQEWLETNWRAHTMRARNTV